MSFISNNMKQLHKNFYSINKEFAYIIGVLHGDGNIMSNKIRFGVTDKNFIQKIKKYLEQISKEKIKIKKIKNNGFKNSSPIYIIVFNSILLKNLIEKQYRNIEKQDDNIIISFLEGCYDSEGCVDKERPRIRLAVINYIYAKKISDCLNKIKIKHTFNKNKKYYWIRIYYPNINKFHQQIHFSIKKRENRLITLVNIEEEKTKKYEIKKQETLILESKEWCNKYNLTRNQYHRHKRQLIN